MNLAFMYLERSLRLSSGDMGSGSGGSGVDSGGASGTAVSDGVVVGFGVVSVSGGGGSGSGVGFLNLVGSRLRLCLAGTAVSAKLTRLSASLMGLGSPA